jgi:hypothetical protein
MMFLDDPPPDAGDRWKKGAEMCAAWGISTSDTAVYRLFRAHAAEWRAGLALRADTLGDATIEGLEEKTARLVSLRVFEVLANPASAPTTLVNLARVELARQKHLDGRRGDTERALAILCRRATGNWEAQFALGQFKKALETKPTKPSPFPPGYLDVFPQLPRGLPGK